MEEIPYGKNGKKKLQKKNNKEFNEKVINITSWN